ncbi:NAD-dependent epimerase/dehydratase family protein [candidate division KSB1 bacterium]
MTATSTTSTDGPVDLKQFYSGKRVVLTGGLGFIGSNLAHRLVDLDARVVLIDNYLPDHGANPANIRDITDKLEVQRADVRSAEDMDRLLPGADLVFHLAAQADHGASLQQPSLDFRINVLGTATVLQCLKRNSPATRLVYCGTRSEYGSPETIPVTESTPLLPLDIYSADKLAGSFLALNGHRLGGLPVICLRPSNLYGPRAQMRHPGYGILNWFIRLAIDNEPITVYGDGLQLRDYTFVVDAADAFCRAGASQSAVGKVFNLGHAKPLALVDLAKKIVAVAGSGRLEFVPWPKGSKRMDVGDYATDSTRLKQLTGWEPVTSIDQGLQNTVEYYRKYRRDYWD